MNVSRIAILGVALIAGAGAFVLMLSQNKDIAPVQIVEPVREETVRVLVSSRDIQRGQRLGAEAPSWGTWPKRAAQPTLITADKSSSLMAAILAPGMRAVTMRVSPETSSGGFILPGDKVDIMLAGGRGSSAPARTIFEDVRVLAVDTLFSENTEASHVAGSNVTLELAPTDAETFISARDAGSLSLVLRSIFKPETELQATDRRSSNVSVIRYGRS